MIPFPSLATLQGWIDTATSTFQQELDRAPESSALAAWLVAFAHGATGEQLRADLKASGEYALKHPPIPPAPAIAPPVSMDAQIKANFCGSRTPWAEVCFDIFLADWTLEQRQQVYAMKRTAGLTHLVLAVEGGYRDQHVFDWRQEPEKLKALIAEVLDQGFRPILALSSGDGGTGANLGYLGPLLDALGPLASECHLFPAWECVKGGWTSKQLADCLATIYRHVSNPYAWFHGSDGRACGSSNPIEADDPWQGDEPGFWKSHGGERLKGLFYQSESGRVLLQADNEPLDYLGQRGYRGRLKECLMRVQDGERGWKPVRFCVFESVAMDYFAGGCSDADVTRVARECAALGVKEFGNGIA